MHPIFIRSHIVWSPALGSEAKYTCQKIRPAEARRMSELTKCSVDIGLRLIEGQTVDHMIFSSRHGEISNTVQLLKMISRREELSPTLFSQSVHNTGAGMLSLVSKSKVATTALGGGRNTFMSGLISSAAYLNENPEAQVLYVSADSLVPDELAANLEEANVPFVVAMLLNFKGEGEAVSFEPLKESSVDIPEVPMPQAIEFAKWFASQNRHLDLNGGSSGWRLTKCSAE